jgi:hypothetical protein
MSQLEVYLCHLGDIHDVRFSASQRERLSRSLLPSRPKSKRQASQCSANRSTKIRSGTKRGTGVFVTYTPRCLRRRLQNQDRRKRARRRSLLNISDLGLAANICGKKRRASSLGIEEIRMTASASNNAKTATMTPSTNNVEQDESLKVHNNLRLSDWGTTSSSESDCAFSPSTLINTDDSCPLVWTSSASPSLETPWSTPTTRSLGDLNEEAVYNPKTHTEGERGHLRRLQPFRIEIPTLPQD